MARLAVAQVHPAQLVVGEGGRPPGGGAYPRRMEQRLTSSNPASLKRRSRQDGQVEVGSSSGVEGAARGTGRARRSAGRTAMRRCERLSESRATRRARSERPSAAACRRRQAVPQGGVEGQVPVDPLRTAAASASREAKVDQVALRQVGRRRRPLRGDGRRQAAHPIGVGLAPPSERGRGEALGAGRCYARRSPRPPAPRRRVTTTRAPGRPGRKTHRPSNPAR